MAVFCFYKSFGSTAATAGFFETTLAVDAESFFAGTVVLAGAAFAGAIEEADLLT